MAYVSKSTKQNEIGIELKNSKEAYRLIYEASSDAIMTLAPPEWKFTSGNPSAIKMFKTKSLKEFVSLGPWKVSPKYQPDGQLSSVKAKKMIMKAMKEGSNFFEWTHKKNSGEEFLTTVLLTRFKIRGKYLLQATVRDITKSKENEIQLKKHVKNLNFLYKLSKVIELDGLLENMYVKILDLLPQAMQWPELICAQFTIDGVEYKTTNFKKTKYFIKKNIFVENKKKGMLEVYYLKNKQFNEDEKNLFNELALRLSEILKKSELETLKNNLIILTTHDLKQPLTPILGYTDLLKNKIVDEKSKEYLDKIIEASMNMSNMINKVLYLFRLESGKLFFNLEKNNLSETVNETLNYKSSVVKLKKIKIIKKFNDNIMAVFDKERLKEVFINLIDNAIKFNKKNGKIIVKIITKKDKVRISIKDTGVGIKQNELPNIFKMFFQSKRNKFVGGSGIGLAMSKKIIENMKGTIVVKSIYNKGSEFIIELPRK